MVRSRGVTGPGCGDSRHQDTRKKEGLETRPEHLDSDGDEAAHWGRRGGEAGPDQEGVRPGTPSGG